ncbi:hypothetical protein ACJ72_02732 [Emergomyces africanus]|uniref:Uncharacterized protein n=1 Tax=Emergomyces africanus TaxID=1955775 RepID=A0A1B7P234_9EURO|nr:hypothetical protein ACJ72_02732 [Emergomyces africanus]
MVEALGVYYGSWKDQDNDISNLWASLDNLSEIFKILSKTIEHPAGFDESMKDSVEKNVKHVYGFVEMLQHELEKVQGASKPEGRLALRRHVRRAIYPFKEETLSKMQRTVAAARQNLNLALQVLQVFVYLLTTTSTEYSKANLTQADLLSNRRQSGTGKWLLHHPDFLEWAKGNKEIIWCQGSPGVGKTVLAATVVEFLESDLPAKGIGLAFVYCDHKSKLAQTTEYFVGAIVRQLVERRQIIPENVHNLYKRHRGKGTNPTYSEYLHLLLSLAKDCSEVYIVIDALDECMDKNSQFIWNDLLTKLKDCVSNLRLLYTSRVIDDLTGILAKSSLIDVRASDADIVSYIQEQLQSKNTLLQFCQQDPTLQRKILENVVSKAEGIFLAARLNLESLASKTNLRAVKKALGRSPTTLDDNYDEAMERIKQQPTRILALRVLLWIVYAVRPLQLGELQHAVAVDELETDDHSVSEECLTPQTIVVNACAGLIKIDQESNIVRLVHMTAQEYFDRRGTKHFPDAHRDIGMACLKFLRLEVFSEGYCVTDGQYQCRLKGNALLKYAAQNFGNHIFRTTDDSYMT